MKINSQYGLIRGLKANRRNQRNFARLSVLDHSLSEPKDVECTQSLTGIEKAKARDFATLKEAKPPLQRLEILGGYFTQRFQIHLVSEVQNGLVRIILDGNPATAKLAKQTPTYFCKAQARAQFGLGRIYLKRVGQKLPWVDTERPS